MHNSSTSSSRLKIATCITLFLTGLWAVDRLIAGSLRHCLNEVTTGQVSGGFITAALADSDADVMVFGSSLARHHIDPELVAQEINGQCYNAGCDGQNIYYARLLEALLLQRGCSSQTFLLVLNWSDLFQDNLAAAKMFNVYRDELSLVSDILDAGEPTNRIKSISRAYRFNGLAVSLLRQWLRPVQEGIDGFARLDRPFVDRESEIRQMKADAAKLNIDELTKQKAEAKLIYYRQFISTAQSAGIRVVFIYGPTLRKGIPMGAAEEYAMHRFRQIADEEGATYLQLDEDIVAEFQDQSLFCDRRHLNSTGAKRFTAMIMDNLLTGEVLIPFSGLRQRQRIVGLP